jgi:hypothetical protein
MTQSLLWLRASNFPSMLCTLCLSASTRAIRSGDAGAPRARGGIESFWIAGATEVGVVSGVSLFPAVNHVPADIEPSRLSASLRVIMRYTLLSRSVTLFRRPS